jgi:hypothetical protein
MDDDRRRSKEYYQVTLDTGRIFWIAFFVGAAIIAIFIFGFYAGGGKVLRGLFTSDKTEIMIDDVTSEEKKRGEELSLIDVLEEDLEDETRSLDVDSIESAGGITEKKPETGSVSTKLMPAEEPDIELYEELEPEGLLVHENPVDMDRGVYTEQGNYFIQVASFLEKSNADAFKEKLEKNLYKVVIEEKVIDEKMFYRVRVGPFGTKGIASNTMISMKNRYNLKDPFVVKKDP